MWLSGKSMFSYGLEPYLVTFSDGSQTVLLAKNEPEAESLGTQAGNGLAVIRVAPLPDR